MSVLVVELSKVFIACYHLLVRLRHQSVHVGYLLLPLLLNLKLLVLTGHDLHILFRFFYGLVLAFHFDIMKLLIKLRNHFFLSFFFFFFFSFL